MLFFIISLEEKNQGIYYDRQSAKFIFHRWRSLWKWRNSIFARKFSYHFRNHTYIYIYPASFAKMPGLLANQQVEKIPLLRKRRKSIWQHEFGCEKADVINSYFHWSSKHFVTNSLSKFHWNPTTKKLPAGSHFKNLMEPTGTFSVFLL